MIWVDGHRGSETRTRPQVYTGAQELRLKGHSLQGENVSYQSVLGSGLPLVLATSRKNHPGLDCAPGRGRRIQLSEAAGCPPPRIQCCTQKTHRFDSSAFRAAGASAASRLPRRGAAAQPPHQSSKERRRQEPESNTHTAPASAEPRARPQTPHRTLLCIHQTFSGETLQCGLRTVPAPKGWDPAQEPTEGRLCLENTTPSLKVAEGRVGSSIPALSHLRDSLHPGPMLSLPGQHQEQKSGQIGYNTDLFFLY